MTTVSANRERQLGEVFVRLADSLVTDFDVPDLLEDLVESTVSLLGSAAGGIMLSDQRGKLALMACSSAQSRVLELLELQNDEGPCLDCFASGTRVEEPELASARRWPRFRTAAIGQGFGAVYALPMRLREQTIGSMNLFCRTGEHLAEDELRVGQALADIATIAILSHRSMRRGEELAEQLQTALNGRITIEQAKGVIAERGKLGMDAAFALLRRHARSSNQALSEVARAVAGGELAPDVVLASTAG